MSAKRVIAGVSVPSSKICMWSWKQGARTQSPVLQRCPHHQFASHAGTSVGLDALQSLGSALAELITSGGELLGWSRRSRLAALRHYLSPQVAACIIKAGRAVSPTWLLGEKGHTGQGCCFPIGPHSQQTGFELPPF